MRLEASRKAQEWENNFIHFKRAKMLDTIRTLIPQSSIGAGVNKIWTPCTTFISRPIENQFIPRSGISLFWTRVGARTLRFFARSCHSYLLSVFSYFIFDGIRCSSNAQVFVDFHFIKHCWSAYLNYPVFLSTIHQEAAVKFEIYFFNLRNNQY